MPHKAIFTELFFLKKKVAKLSPGTQFKIIDRTLAQDIATEEDSFVNLVTLLENETRIALKEEKEE